MRTRLFGWLSRAVREPLVHFLFAGTVIFALAGLRTNETVPDSDTTIRVTAAHIEWLEQSWQSRWRRAPTPAELDGLVEAYIKENVLYRKALAMGLDEDDVIIRRRMSQKLEFLVQDLAASTPPTEEALEAYFAEHRERYRNPALHTITHVFFDPDKRDEQTLDDANGAKQRLAALGEPGQDIDEFGDRFMLQSYYPQKSEDELAKFFGTGFASSITGLPVGTWNGPMLSGYGVHLVYVPPPHRLAGAGIGASSRPGCAGLAGRAAQKLSTRSSTSRCAPNMT